MNKWTNNCVARVLITNVEQIISIYVSIYIYVCIYIYIYIYIYIIYLYELCAGFNFSRWFYLIIVTSRNSQPNCEHDQSYQ